MSKCIICGQTAEPGQEFCKRCGYCEKCNSWLHSAGVQSAPGSPVMIMGYACDRGCKQQSRNIPNVQVLKKAA